MGQMLKKGVHVATTIAGDYLQFYERAHAVQAVEQCAQRRGIEGCRWSEDGLRYVAPDGRVIGKVGSLKGTKGASGGCMVVDAVTASTVAKSNPRQESFPCRTVVAH